MTTGFTLRPATPLDHSALRSMFAEVTAEGTTYPYETADAMFAAWTGPNTDLTVAVRADDATPTDGTPQPVVGAYLLRPNQPGRGDHVANGSYLVAAAARGQRVGRALAVHSLERAAVLGYRALQFNLVVETNAASLALWDRLGFDRIGRVPGAFRHPTRGDIDAWILHRALAPRADPARDSTTTARSSPG